MKLKLTIVCVFILALATTIEIIASKNLMSQSATARSTILLVSKSETTLKQSNANEEQLWQRAIAKNPKDQEAYHQLGNLLVARDRLDEAIEAYQTAITLISETNHKSGDFSVYKSLGDALVKQNKLEDAIAAFRKGVELGNADVSHNQADSAAYFRLGLALEKEHRFDEATDAYRHAIAFNPEDDYIYEFLGNAFVEKNDLSEFADVGYFEVKKLRMID